jgi:hypothetical protein
MWALFVMGCFGRGYNIDTLVLLIFLQPSVNNDVYTAFGYQTNDEISDTII